MGMDRRRRTEWARSPFRGTTTRSLKDIAPLRARRSNPDRSRPSVEEELVDHRPGRGLPEDRFLRIWTLGGHRTINMVRSTTL